jgi:hypothetical protein
MRRRGPGAHSLKVRAHVQENKYMRSVCFLGSISGHDLSDIRALVTGIQVTSKS